MKKTTIILILFICLLLISSIVHSAMPSLSNGSFDTEVTKTQYTPSRMVVLNYSSFDTEVTKTQYIPSQTMVTLNSSSFDTEVNVIPDVYTIDVEIVPINWDVGNPFTGDSRIQNFTFYQNGTATIDITIGFNETNYSFVNYSTWNSDGHDQYCSNFTIDSWSTEINIQPKIGDSPVTTLKNSVAGSSSFVFGIRIFMPKTLTYAGAREDFKIMFNMTQS